MRAMIPGPCEHVDCDAAEYSDDLRCGGVGMGIVDCKDPAGGLLITNTRPPLHLLLLVRV